MTAKNIITEEKLLVFAGRLKAEEKAEATIEKYRRTLKRLPHGWAGGRLRKKRRRNTSGICLTAGGAKRRG